MSRLIICGSDGKPMRIVESEGRVITIGRSSENHVQIDDLNSSRHHCEVHEKDGSYEVIDKDSRNGIFVNGHRVTRKLLEAGDKIEIGTTIIYFDRLIESEEGAEQAGKATVDISTGIFSPVGDPTGVHEQLASAMRTSRISRTEKEALGLPTAPAKKGTSRRLSEDETSDAIRPRIPLTSELIELRRLLALNKTFNTELNLKRLLERVMDTVIEVSGAERGFLIMREGSTDFRVKVSRNIDRESIRDARDKISNSLVKEVMESGGSVLLTDAAQDQRYAGRDSILNMKLRSVLVVPLRHRGSVNGAIYLDNRFASSRFDAKNREQLELVADSASIAIENALLFEENARQKEELLHAKEELERLNQSLRERVEVQDRELNRARKVLAERREELQLKYNYDNIVTQSPRMLEIFMILDKVTDSSVPVMIQGQSGTGKELVARALHFNGPRKKARFISENCAAIPANLMESEFFGYVRGAFTGAHADKIGLFEMADGGTLFLDEIGDMDLDMQTKLLRVLQDGVLRRVGSKEFKRVNVRIVSATNRDLLAIMKEGKFREDLYYRLNVINIQLPPLSERKEDVPLLTEYFLEKQGKQPGQTARELTPEALDLFLRYNWPGNIRELENEILRSCALSSDRIHPEHLSRGLVEGARTPSPDAKRAGHLREFTLSGRTLKEVVSQTTDEIERQAITEVLRHTNYKKSKSASILGISRPTLDAKIEKFGLSRETILAPDA